MKYRLWMVCVVWLLTWISPLSAQTPDADLSKANELYDLKKYPEARDAFARWLAAYGVHPLRAVVMFNMGLAWEKEEKWDRALDAYKKSMEISQKGSAEFKDALYRAVFCYEKLGDWKSAKMSLGALEGYTLTTYRLAEFSIRKWYLDWLQSEKGAGPKPSLDDLEKNYQRFEKLRRTGVVPFDSLEIFARAALTLGRNKVSLLKTPKNKDEFETMANGILEAQHYLFQTLSFGGYSDRRDALYVLGSAYEKWIQSGMEIPPPQDLEGSEREAYVNEMKRELLPLYDRVVAIYEKEYDLSLKSNATGLNRALEDINVRVLRAKGVVNQWRREVSSAKP